MNLFNLFEGNEQAYNWHSEPEQRSMDATRQARLNREREPEGSEAIDARLRARNDQLAQYAQSGNFWLKQKDTQQHLSDAIVGKAAANAAALELLKQQPELRGNLVITAHGPDESSGVAEGMLDNPGEQDSPVAQAIIRRILLQRTDLLAKHGPEKVGAAVDEVADFVGDVDEIGSSDVSGWIRHVEQMLGNMNEQGVAEAEIDRPGMKDGRPYSDPYRRHPGNSSYMTPEYLIQKYKERLEQIAAGPYKRPKEVAQLQSRIAKLEKQGVAEGNPGYDKHSFVGKIRRGIEADKKGWGQLGNLFAADKEEDAMKALRRGNRYYNMTRGSNRTPGGFPKTTVEEGSGNIGQQIQALYQKIYDQGDDAVESMYYDSPIFAQYWDEYEGDLDSIIAEVDPSELQVILAELQSAAEDQGLAEAPGAETLGHNQSTVASNLNSLDLGEGDISQLEKDIAAAPVAPIANMEGDEKIGGRYDADDFDAMVMRLKKLAGSGPMQTKYDPNKRVYKNVPVAQQPGDKK